MSCMKGEAGFGEGEPYEGARMDCTMRSRHLAMAERARENWVISAEMRMLSFHALFFIIIACVGHGGKGGVSESINS
jgi:hypothetical protein